MTKQTKDKKSATERKIPQKQLKLLLPIEEGKENGKENGFQSNYFKHKKQTLEAVFKRCMGVFCNIAAFNLQMKSLKSTRRSSVVAKLYT